MQQNHGLMEWLSTDGQNTHLPSWWNKDNYIRAFFLATMETIYGVSEWSFWKSKSESYTKGIFHPYFTEVDILCWTFKLTLRRQLKPWPITLDLRGVALSCLAESNSYHGGSNANLRRNLSTTIFSRSIDSCLGYTDSIHWKMCTRYEGNLPFPSGVYVNLRPWSIL